MSIKRLACFCVFIASLIIACAGEKDPYLEQSEVEFQGAGCLADTFSKFDLFVAGELKNQEVAEFWDCISTALDAVERRVVGTAGNGNFKANDLRWFVGTYFLDSGKPDGIEITDVLLDEMMEIKRQFLGGSRQTLTREELNLTKALVKEFKLMSLKVNPYIKLLFYENSDKKMPDQHKTSVAIDQFASVVDRLGYLVGQQQNAYEFDRLIRLIEEIDVIFDKKGKDLPQWVDYIPTLQKVKSLFLNSSEEKIEFDEWPSVARVLGQGLSVFFRAKHFLRLDALHDLKTVSEYKLMYSNVNVILREGLARRPDQDSFSNEDFGGIIESLAEKDLLGDFLSADEIKNLWIVLVDKVLTPDERVTDGLAVKELEEAQKIFDDWYATQRWLLGEPKSDEQIQEMVEVLQTPWAYRTDEEGRLIFDDNKTLTPNIESTTNLNWERAAFGLVLRAYVEDPDERKERKGLTKEELDIGYADLKPLLVQLGLVDEDDESFIERMYLYSSLFMPRSNGDFLLDFFEMIEYAHFVLAGLDMGGRFIGALPEGCVLNEEEGLVDYQCWRVGFRELFADRYANMPFMVDFMTALDEKAFYRVMDGLESAVRDSNDPEVILRSDIYEAGIFLQFIETLMFRYDSDRSGFLDIQEGLLAVPLFTPQLKDLVDIDSDKEVKIILTFMMKYGKPPDISNPLSILRYLHWRWTQKSWKIHTDRWKIIQILSSISDFL